MRSENEGLFWVGDVVVLHSLASRPDLNGHVASVLGRFIPSRERYPVRLLEAAGGQALLARPSTLRRAVSIGESRACASKGLFTTAKVSKDQCILCEPAWSARDVQLSELVVPAEFARFPFHGVSQAWGLVQKWLSSGPPSFAGELCRNDHFAESQLKGEGNELDAALIDLFATKHGCAREVVFDAFSKCVTNFFHSQGESNLSALASKINHAPESNVRVATLEIAAGSVVYATDEGVKAEYEAHGREAVHTKMVCVFALSDLEEGTELVIDYGKGYSAYL